MKKILDACCGARQFWFQPQNIETIYVDQRSGVFDLCDGRKIEVTPDIQCDFRLLPFKDETFWHIVFDPPHIKNLGENSFMGKRFGSLDEGWQDLIRDGFDECWRVLKTNGTLIFKWNETSFTTKQVISAIGKTPLYGHKSGKAAKTQWLCFFKSESDEQNKELPSPL